jgi:hypothetical protein
MTYSILFHIYKYVTPGFEAKTICSSYVCLESSCDTYSQNVNTKNQCLKYINFITRILSLDRRLYWHSHRVAAEQANPTGNQPGATYASRRSLHHRSPSHLRLLSSVTARVSRFMVATQVSEEENIIIYMQAPNKTKALLQKVTYM